METSNHLTDKLQSPSPNSADGSEFNQLETCTISPNLMEPNWDFSDSLRSSSKSANISSPTDSPTEQILMFTPFNEPHQTNDSITLTALQFIRNHIYSDEKCLFDRYVSVLNGENESNPSSDVLPMNMKTGLRINIMSANQIFESELNIPHIAILSRRGWNSGAHQISFKILECDNYRQEIGIVSAVSDIESVKLHSNGLRNTKCLNARAVYGSAPMSSTSSYYGSYNQDGSQRCYKILSKKDKFVWSVGDVIKMCIDFDKNRIKFYVNEVKIRKTLSLELNHTYFPILSFYGECKYELLSFR